MSYINPAWIADEHFEYLEDNFDLTKYDSEVDDMINAVCAAELVPVPDIPVDGNGYVTSIALKVYGKLMYKFYAFEGYWGKRTGDLDIYNAKLLFLERQISNAQKLVNKNTIISPTVETEVISDFNNVQQSAY
jgi:hypothetical protein